MNMLILNSDRQAELAALNASGDPALQLQPVPVSETYAVLNADLLQDCGPGQTWKHYAALLEALPVEEVELPAQTSI